MIWTNARYSNQSTSLNSTKVSRTGNANSGSQSHTHCSRLIFAAIASTNATIDPINPPNRYSHALHLSSWRFGAKRNYQSLNSPLSRTLREALMAFVRAGFQSPLEHWRTQRLGRWEESQTLHFYRIPVSQLTTALCFFMCKDFYLEIGARGKWGRTSFSSFLLCLPQNFARNTVSLGEGSTHSFENFTHDNF